MSHVTHNTQLELEHYRDKKSHSEGRVEVLFTSFVTRIILSEYVVIEKLGAQFALISRMNCIIWRIPVRVSSVEERMMIVQRGSNFPRIG